jgi:hypothetical protein
MRRSLRRILAVMFATACFLGVAVPAAQAAYPGANGKIVYVQVEEVQDPDLPFYRLNLQMLDAVDDPSPTEVSRGLDFSPAWSPGGTMIAYVSGGPCEGLGDIALRDADGTFLRRLTGDSCQIEDGDPSWAPDGSRIVFTREDDLYSVRPDGGGLTRLTSGGGTHPAWSPDGTRIAFTSIRRGAAELYLLNLTEIGPARLTRLTDNAGSVRDDFEAEWSPDGSTLLFTRFIDHTERHIHRMSPVATGSPAPRFIEDASLPAFSPDGTELLYVAAGVGGADIFVVEATNPAAPAAVTTAAAADTTPTWQPVPEFALVDARFSPFESAIRWIFDSDIANGCSLERFCPDGQVTRGQMAVFLDRALDLPPAAVNYFTDDEGRSFEGAINRVRQAGIAFGCGPNTYCPDAPVSRGQMAAFLDRALDPPSTTSDYFSDDEGRTFEGAVNRLRAAGIAFGCTATTYCPGAVVRRGQMAAFLQRALAP